MNSTPEGFLKRFITDRLRRSEFTRNVATLVTGSLFARVIPLAAVPFMTRLYEPAAFGVFALYASVVAILTIFLTGRYDLAIMQPREDGEGVNVLALAIALAAVLGVVSLGMVVWLVQYGDLSWGGLEPLAMWLYFVPVGGVMAAAYQSLMYWHVRKKNFKALAVNRILQSSCMTGFSLLFGWMGVGEGGLIVGNLLGTLFSAVHLSWHLFRDALKPWRCVSWVAMRAMSKAYLDYPKKMIFSRGIGVVHQQIPFLFISRFFGVEVLGHVSMARRLVYEPVSLVANNIGDVFRQRATEDFQKTGKFDEIFIKIVKVAFFVALFPCLMLFFTLEELFPALLGEGWIMAGVYAKVILVAGFFSFFCTPIDKGALIVNRLGYITLWHVSLFVAHLLLIFVTWFYEGSIMAYLWGYVAVIVTHYLVDMFMEYRFSLGEGADLGAGGGGLARGEGIDNVQ